MRVSLGWEGRIFNGKVRLYAVFADVCFITRFRTCKQKTERD